MCFGSHMGNLTKIIFLKLKFDLVILKYNIEVKIPKHLYVHQKNKNKTLFIWESADIYRRFSRSRQLGGLVPVFWLEVPPRKR